MNGKIIGIIAFLAISISLVLLDIFIVEIFYRPTEDWGNIWKYHCIYLGLIAILPIMASIKLRSLMPMATWIFFITGIEDTLFYWLQGYLPEIYWGVYVLGVWEAPLEFVLKANILGIVCILVYLAIVCKLKIEL